MAEPWVVHHGDCLDVLPTLADGSMEATYVEIARKRLREGDGPLFAPEVP